MTGHKYQLTPNLFAISFGTAGLAQAWTVARGTVDGPEWVGVTLWLFAAVLWLATLVAYTVNSLAQRRFRRGFTHPVTGPFTALIPITPMLFGVALKPYAEEAGKVIYIIALVGTVILGGWITAAWIRVEMKLVDWHPGYFIPTAAGGLISAGGAAAFGWTRLAQLMFGWGVVCWVVLGSILLLRLFTQPALPKPLLPVIAIELAPPVVAGNVWFAMNGGRVDFVASALAGYAILMALVQVSLVPTYRTAPFGPPYWAFGFTYAAAVTDLIHWLSIENVDGRREVTYALLAAATVSYAALCLYTFIKITRGAFFAKAPVTASA
ncbi:TDT family transporter [Streptomyces sp. NPDC001914]|uniref:SLAC1 family transporter n=1 Tax=Streptomyces sp. NPDC001914 TaxID=3364623 RepID=UPI0036BFC40B